MARPLRFEAPGNFFHVLARGNAKHPIFIDDRDRERFLETLGEAVSRFQVRCHTYCLMANHYHLLLQPMQETLSRAVRHLNGVYSQRFNRRHQRVGHVFAGRFKSLLVDREHYLLMLCRYIALNPVRSGAVREPADWRWSGHRALVGTVAAPDWLTPNEILEAFDPRGDGFARDAYARFVEEGIRPDRASELDELDRAVDLGGILGSSEFIANFSRRLDRSRGNREHSKRERFVDRPPLERILGGKDVAGLAGRIESARRDHGYSLDEIGRVLGIDRRTVVRLARASKVDEEIVAMSHFKT
jgi:REP element-mobilizing transposase RayT